VFPNPHGSARLEEPQELVAEARRVLRRRYFEADVGLTGANFLIAETGSVVLVTNEGNAELTHGLPKAHIVVTSIEKVVPTFEDACTLLRILARSATGQEFSTYTTLVTGPKRAEDLDGPEAFHVVLLDNGRSRMIGTHFQEMLRCIRCGACMNHCPVYLATGGHAYGWVYVGPMGAVLTPNFIGIEQAHPLPNASTFCGRCEEVCPVRIPLPKLMRHWREREFERNLSPATVRSGIGIWAYFALRPRLYRWAVQRAVRTLKRFGGLRGRMHWLPLAGGWTRHRDFPVPDRDTFQVQWQKQKKAEAKARAEAARQSVNKTEAPQ
jgi:L-lactate dehydrogenase complex protein LldF